MSKDLVQDISDMHRKFGVNKRVAELISENPKSLIEFLRFRLDFLQEEIDETRDKGLLARNPEEIVDGLVDLVVVAIGTADAFSIDFNEAWNRVHNANMAKEPGIKPERPNPHGFPDLIKPDGWVGPNHEGLHGYLPAVFFASQNIPEDE